MQAGVLLLVTAIMSGATGCGPRARVLPAEDRKPIDRSVIEGPTGFTVQRYITGLTAPTSMTFDGQGNLLIAEGGLDGRAPAIYGFSPDGERFTVYRDPQLPFGIGSPKFKLYGPIGGMIWHDGRLYVSHRDANRKGVISALDYDGNRQTIVAGMPAQGDYGLTDLAVGDNRLYFGIGTATNSGVVGLDNWQVGWPRRYGKVHDLPWTKLRLRGVRMDSRNPQAGLFGPGEKAVTGPFQPFDVANKSWVYPPQNGKFNGAIYSVALDGGDLQAEATGIRLPRGLAFNPSGLTLFFTNNGMELRGSRPVRDDPDVLCRLVRGTWYGWPDYSADFNDITLPRYQPPLELLFNTGYDALPLLVDQAGSGTDRSGLRTPSRETLLRGAFPSQSGAAKLAMAPRTGPFERYYGSAIVALSGDRAPFATSNQKLIGPIGYKVVRVNVDNQQVEDFLRNTRGLPARRLPRGMQAEALERPVDVKFGPDGSLYVLDLGWMEVKNGRERVREGSGRVFRIVPTEAPAGEQPAGDTPRDGDQVGVPSDALPPLPAD